MPDFFTRYDTTWTQPPPYSPPLSSPERSAKKPPRDIKNLHAPVYHYHRHAPLYIFLFFEFRIHSFIIITSFCRQIGYNINTRKSKHCPRRGNTVNIFLYIFVNTHHFFSTQTWLRVNKLFLGENSENHRIQFHRVNFRSSKNRRQISTTQFAPQRNVEISTTYLPPVPYRFPKM